jgi:hypothetical protein
MSFATCSHCAVPWNPYSTQPPRHRHVNQRRLADNRRIPASVARVMAALRCGPFAGRPAQPTSYGAGAATAIASVELRNLGPAVWAAGGVQEREGACTARKCGSGYAAWEYSLINPLRIFLRRLGVSTLDHKQRLPTVSGLLPGKAQSLRRQVMRQIPPLTTGPVLIEDRVHDLPQRVAAQMPDTDGCRAFHA